MTHTTASEISTPHSFESRLTVLRSASGWIIAFGVALIALGILAFSSVVTATIVSVYFVGISMLVAGVAEIAIGMRARSWASFFIWIAVGVLYGFAGLFTLTNPLLAAGGLTLLLGAALIGAGLIRVFLAFQMQARSAWGWMVLSGALTAAVGVCILAQWPVSSLYILGVFLSVDLLFAGVGWLAMGMTLSRQKLNS